MIQAIEILRNVAGVMFWALANLLLGGLWFALIIGVLNAISEGNRHDK